MIKLQSSAIHKSVDQMRRNKYRWKAYENLNSKKQSKHKSDESKKKEKNLNENHKMCFGKN